MHPHIALLSRNALGAAATALILAGCSTGSAGTDVSELSGIHASAPAPSASPHGPAVAGAGGGLSLAPDQCVDLPEAQDGVYRVGEAGTATVVREGNRLVLVEHRAADGWVSRVDDLERDEVEIDFRRGGEVLDLEVELDDGRVEVEICADDD
ncbi:MAG TPA: hypothetical protein VK935_18720 [Actinomycetospora sp.]|nr:hypothetical protein [Actinomycetospora sp.]